MIDLEGVGLFYPFCFCPYPIQANMNLPANICSSVAPGIIFLSSTHVSGGGERMSKACYFSPVKMRKVVL